MWQAMTKLEKGANKEMCINAVRLMQLATKLRHCSSMATHDISHCMQHVAFGAKTTQNLAVALDGVAHTCNEGHWQHSAASSSIGCLLHHGKEETGKGPSEKLTKKGRRRGARRAEDSEGQEEDQGGRVPARRRQMQWQWKAPP